MRYRRVFAAVVLAALGGCGALDLAPGARDGVLEGGAAPEGAAAQLFARGAVPGGAVLTVSVTARGVVSVMVPEADNGAHRSWISADGVGLQFLSGMLSGTRGLGHDLMNADNAQSAALVLAARPGQVVRIHRHLDGLDQIEIRSFVCDITSRGARSFEGRSGQFETTLMQEDCHGPGQAFRNLYWVRSAGPSRVAQIVQSRQWAGWGIGALALRVEAGGE